MQKTTIIIIIPILLLKRIPIKYFRLLKLANVKILVRQISPLGVNTKKLFPQRVPSNFYFYLSGESAGGLRFGTYIELEKNILKIADYPNEIKTYELSNEQVHEFYSLVLEKDLFNYLFTWDEVVYGSGCMDCSPQAEHVLRIKAGDNIMDINLWEKLEDETYRINQDYELLSELEQKLISFIDSKDQSDN